MKLNKCIYINTGLHSRLKVFCSSKGLLIKAWLEAVITKELNTLDCLSTDKPTETYPANQAWSDVASQVNHD